MQIKDKLIVALDVETAARAFELVNELREVAGMFKIGSTLFTAVGPSIVKEIVGSGSRVFLDLKFHDIPHQVAGAAQSAAELGVSLFTVHASGGAEMMKRAAEAVAEVAERNGTPRAAVLAISVLTSVDAAILSEIGVSGSPAESVIRLVKLGAASGVDGVVASPQEVANIRANVTNTNFLVVTPGIRASQTADDQRRVATPAAALSAGADYLVVGRPITGAPDPLAAAHEILKDMERAQPQHPSGTAA
jgi:orotidine-5'-phosphate decarboxylase